MVDTMGAVSMCRGDGEDAAEPPRFLFVCFICNFLISFLFCFVFVF